MKISIESTPLRDALIVRHEVFKDHRGFFMEAYQQREFEKSGLPSTFVQLNHSGSVQNVLRGLHFQWDPPMGKLMRVVTGSAFLVTVDIRHGSPTLGKWFGMSLAAEDRTGIWAPAGFARGFAVLSEFAEIEYFCTGMWNKNGESGIVWNDPTVGIDWRLSQPILSDKDRDAQTLAQWLSRSESRHFRYEE